MQKVYNYLKYLGVFLIFELFLIFIVSLFNLLGVKSGITSIVLLVFSSIIVFVLSFLNARKVKKRGYLEGLKMGLLYLVMMYLIKIILFSGRISLPTFIYYIILLLVAILGGMFGRDKKEDK